MQDFSGASCPLPTVVRIEFSGETPVRSFGDLVAGLPHGGEVVLDPLRAPGVAAGPGYRAQAEYWTERLAAEDGPFVVLGYCSGANLALALASALRAAGREVSTIGLFDPITFTLAQVREVAVEIAAALDPTGDAELCPLPANRETAVPNLLSFVGEVLDAALGDLPEDTRAQLLTRYAAWIGYSLSATEPVAAPAGVDIHVFASDDLIAGAPGSSWGAPRQLGGSG
ncbi:thioesterase domain-containing protein, partial [Kitasatospora sp. NPDC085464]|uniref:thioesterase domain-containing protein n=1 Tax=Kitasatospora sp. NPDC085464 TaxID=3364063 RepID=UPI0037CC1586